MDRAWTQKWFARGAVATLALWLSGCAAFNPITGLPASRVPALLQAERRADMKPIDLVRLRQDPPDVYLLGPRDVLGIYIEGILGDREQLPPVHYPESGNVPPALGYPIPIREDGTLALPLVRALPVEGMTLVQAEEAIRKLYTVENKILQPQKDRIIVTLIRPRTYQVVVIRQELGSGPVTAQASQSLRTAGAANSVTKQGAGYILDLRAYENDLLHALTATGGLPGLDAKNEVKILRGAFREAEQRDRMMGQLSVSCDPCSPRIPIVDDANVVKIPIRYSPGDEPYFTQEDIILRTGDVVLIESRDIERFYTGGLLPGGEYQLPRDYDLDILGAIAIAGGAIGAQSSSRGSTLFQGGGGSLGGLIQPSIGIVVRNVPGGSTIPIKVNLQRALLDSRQRVLIQPGDIVLVQYTPLELLGNMFLSSVQFNILYDAFRQN